MKIFQSTHPLRDATHNRHCITIFFNYFNPRTPYGMRLVFNCIINFIKGISIHAPLTGCDMLLRKSRTDDTKISIHAPLTGCDCIISMFHFHKNISIHAPLTGCDINYQTKTLYMENFNPRTPYGMRHNDST